MTQATARAAWCIVALLSLIGVTAAAGRALFVADLAARVEPIRPPILRFFGVEDPHADERPREVARFDRQFAAHRFATLLHVVPGGAFLFLAPLQFSSSVRSRWGRFHRWSGRLLVALAVVISASAMFFGVFKPIAGAPEAVTIAIISAVFLGAITRAFVAIRNDDVGSHREWMIRAMAVASGISTVRVVSLFLDVVLTPAGVRPVEIYVISLWIGWTLMVAAAEIWIRTTRPLARAAAGDALRTRWGRLAHR